MLAFLVLAAYPALYLVAFVIYDEGGYEKEDADS